jgi:hypothetical protein
MTAKVPRRDFEVALATILATQLARTGQDEPLSGPGCRVALCPEMLINRYAAWTGQDGRHRTWSPLRPTDADRLVLDSSDQTSLRLDDDPSDVQNPVSLWQQNMVALRCARYWAGRGSGSDGHGCHNRSRDELVMSDATDVEPEPVLQMTASDWASAIHEAVMLGTAPLLERIEALENAQAEFKYCGTFEHGHEYRKGNFVTDKSALWHCERSTTTRPGDNGDAWRLACKAPR